MLHAQQVFRWCSSYPSRSTQTARGESDVISHFTLPFKLLSCERILMSLCQSAEVKGWCEGQWFMCLLCSLVAAVCHVYREGDCSCTGMSFWLRWPRRVPLMTYTLLLSFNISFNNGPVAAACLNCPAVIHNNKKHTLSPRLYYFVWLPSPYYCHLFGKFAGHRSSPQ